MYLFTGGWAPRTGNDHPVLDLRSVNFLLNIPPSAAVDRLTPLRLVLDKGTLTTPWTLEWPTIVGMLTKILPRPHLLLKQMDKGTTVPLLPRTVPATWVKVIVTLQKAVFPPLTTLHVVLCIPKKMLIKVPLLIVEARPIYLQTRRLLMPVRDYMGNLALLRLFKTQVRIPWALMFTSVVTSRWN